MPLLCKALVVEGSRTIPAVPGNLLHRPGLPVYQAGEGQAESSIRRREIKEATFLVVIDEKRVNTRFAQTCKFVMKSLPAVVAVDQRPPPCRLIDLRIYV